MPLNNLPQTSEVLLKTDASKQFLDALIGQGWDTWGQGLGGDSSAIELMLNIFAAFNLVALAVISAFFMWVMAISVASTASEGVPFGKKYDSLWMPVRFVGAMGALAPIFKGLSLFQVAILSCVGLSINMGNYVWSLGTDYFVEHGGQLTVQAPDQSVSQYSTILHGALESLTMQYYLADHRKVDIIPDGEWAYSENLFRAGGEYKFIFNGNLGTITVGCVNPGDALCTGKQKAVDAAVTSLKPLAQSLADSKIPISSIEPLALYDASNAIHAEILDKLKIYSKQGQLAVKLKDFQDQSRQYGWFIAGSSYWSISWINQEVRDAMYSGISYNSGELSSSEKYALTYRLLDYSAMQERLANYINTAYGIRRGISDTTAHPSVTDETRSPESLWNGFQSLINKTVLGNMLPTAVNSLSTNDPIMALANIGDYMIGSAYLVGGTLAATVIAKNFGSKIPLVGHFAKLIPIEPFLTMLFFSFLLPLFIYGITLAYFLPAIPFIRWIAALAGWVILLVESLIAAPLWLCAHALPEGDGAAGQHGKRGYMLLLGVLIRPPLMVVGFFSAVLLMNVMGKLIGLGFLTFLGGASQARVMGITASIAMLVILGVVVIMLANKFFSLIHYLPEQVTNWIGQQFHSLGEKGDQAETKGSYDKATGVISSGGQGAKELANKPSKPKISEQNLA